MLRLYADLVPQLPDRMLYLDTDVICRRPFAAFYHESMTGVDIAGALDHYGKWWFHHRLMWFDYLNSGVLLMNLARIRADGLLARCRQLLQQRWLFMPDQSALNKLAKCKRILPPKYNEQHKLEPDTVFLALYDIVSLLAAFSHCDGQAVADSCRSSAARIA